MSKQREAFEKEHDLLDLRRHPEHGFYLNKLTQAYWEGAGWAWQASRAAALEEAARLAYENGWRYVAKEIRLRKEQS